MGQHMRLEQRLTPQLIQSMAILQKSVTDLEAHIADALESNAALELAEPETKEEESTGGAQSQEDEGFARLDGWTRNFEMEGSDRAPPRLRRSVSDERDAKMGALANTAGREASLNEHLLAQWSLMDHDDDVRRAGEVLINHLDPDGYLRVRFEQMAASVRPALSMELLEAALGKLHELDPPGIGARDVVECLLLQLDRLRGDNQLERTLIECHLDDIIHNRLPLVAKAMNISIGEINEAIKAMGSMLCLHPGFLVGDHSVPVIRPDVIIEYANTGGELTVRMARGNAPTLRIREDVAQLAKTSQNGKETRAFARKHLEEAAALIDAVKFRHQRLLEVSRSIVEKQRDFFDIGPQGLKMLRMSDLAEELGCDPSTISRTVAEKYMQSPRGMYPLRYFFTGGTETAKGESMGWDRVKTRVQELVRAEEKTKPLKDDQIASRLRDEGIEISRRTVAKYRQQLDIPAARQRKQF